MEDFLCKRTRVNIDINESCVVKELSFRMFYKNSQVKIYQGKDDDGIFYIIWMQNCKYICHWLLF